jgi:hypothetical protein
MKSRKLTPGDIFIAGGQPNITYIQRTQLSLEEQLQDYLDTGYKLLSVTGPTKSGKTVLCRKLIPKEDGVWITGGQVKTEEDFWNMINDKLDVHTQLNFEESSDISDTQSGGLNNGLNIGIVKFGTTFVDTQTEKKGVKLLKSYQKNSRLSAINALLEAKVPLVIDDFHYIDKNIQTSIVRALKEPIFEGLRVIVLAVPHRAYDAVRVETEMTGRVQQLSIPLWSYLELKQIAVKGFPELNVECSDVICTTLAKESYGSPHLMQEFCLRLCLSQGIREKKSEIIKIKEPEDFRAFFKNIVKMSTSKIAFERLARGPRQRTDRVKRKFVDGSEGDIYVGILKALSKTGPKVEISYEQLRDSLRHVIVGNLPQAHEITRVLTKMSEIAKNDIEGEPVIDWVKEDSTLYISDPFFAFFLKWHE